MGIDTQARSKLNDYLLHKKENQNLFNKLNELKPDNQSLEKIHTAIVNSSNSRQIPLLEQLITGGNSLLDAVKSLRIELPKIYTVQGEIKVNSIPPVQIKNFTDLQPYFNNLAKAIQSINTNLKVDLPPFPVAEKPEIQFPDSFNLNRLEDVIAAIDQVKLALLSLPTPKPVSIPKSFSVNKFDELLDGIEELKKGFNLLVNKEVAEVGFPDKEIPVTVTNFKYPAPVTNVSLNALGGVFQTTAVTVTSALTPLPAIALANRRGIVIYNNGAQTMEIGGASFTFGNGIPVPAGTYSLPIDAGSLFIVYGRVVSGSVDCRVAETSDINIGR